MTEKRNQPEFRELPRRDPNYDVGKTVEEIREYNRAFYIRLRKYAEYLNSIEKPIVDDLKAHNIDVEGVSDLVNTNAPYFQALPILAHHISLDYPPPILESLARALTVKGAREIALDPLVERYRQLTIITEPELSTLKFALANAIAYIARKDDIPKIIDLLMFEAHGETRTEFVRFIARYHKTRPDLAEVLAKVKGGPHVQREVDKALMRFKRQQGD